MLTYSSNLVGSMMSVPDEIRSGIDADIGVLDHLGNLRYRHVAVAEADQIDKPKLRVKSINLCLSSPAPMIRNSRQAMLFLSSATARTAISRPSRRARVPW